MRQVFAAVHESVHVHIASFRRDVEFVRYRGKTDIDQAAPIERDLGVRALEFSAQVRTEA
jgi:hypothetical protein